jgi:hypothetical protein
MNWVALDKKAAKMNKNGLQKLRLDSRISLTERQASKFE